MKNSIQLIKDRFNYELAYKVSGIKFQYQCLTPNGLDIERDWADVSPVVVAFQCKRQQDVSWLEGSVLSSLPLTS